MKRYCFALDLEDDPAMIAEYERWHTNIWPEIHDSITRTGITRFDIYRAGNRMFTIMETVDLFSLEDKARSDAEDPKVQEWEALMSRYQKSLPFAKPGEKWVLMKKIFEL